MWRSRDDSLGQTLVSLDIDAIRRNAHHDSAIPGVCRMRRRITRPSAVSQQDTRVQEIGQGEYHTGIPTSNFKKCNQIKISQ